MRRHKSAHLYRSNQHAPRFSGSACFFIPCPLALVHLNNFAFQALASIPLNDAERSSTIRGIKEYLIEHIHEPFDLDKLPAEFTFNKSHLCRIFKENEHKTMYRFLSEIRIQEA